MKRLITFGMFLAVFLGSCGPIIPGSGSGESTPVEITGVVSTVVASTVGTPGTEVPFLTPELPTLIPTLPSATLSSTQLKYKILDQFPDFFFCDPDLYPIAHDDEMPLALQRFSELQANQEEFQAILDHNGLSSSTTFTDDQKLLIYRDNKKLNAVYFELLGDKYQFQIQTGSESQQGLAIKGTIDGNGAIDVQERNPSFPTCPICLAVGTLIDTPRGAISVENLRVGDPVWTLNEAGEHVSAIILKVGSVRVPATHQMIHVRLSDGRELWASPGHPTANARALDSFKVGEILDSAHIVVMERLQYKGTTTYDLLPSGDTGFYWANGILMSTTLAKEFGT
jgi:Hint domain-containing protein